MKKNYIISFVTSLIIIINFSFLTVKSQSPNQFKYQAVLRDTSGNIIGNQQKSVVIDIIQDSVTGTIVFTEAHNLTTTNQGIINLDIGSIEDLSGINWATKTYFIKIRVDGEAMGTSQLLSVPYALHATTAETITGSGSHYIGELYGGGVVFWIDHTGQHGLICSLIDVSNSHQWDSAPQLEGADSDWNGLSNSVKMSGWTINAGDECLNYTNDDYATGIYSDWYLPGYAELNHIWNNIYELHKALDSDGNSSTTTFEKSYYWSSTEKNETQAYYFSFNGGGGSYNAKTTFFRVRAVRAF